MRYRDGRSGKFAAEADLIVVLGGDGTMISTARLIGDLTRLVLGINYGSLGYLTEFRIEEMFPALESVLAGEFMVDSRVMLTPSTVAATKHLPAAAS